MKKFQEYIELKEGIGSTIGKVAGGIRNQCSDISKGYQQARQPYQQQQGQQQGQQPTAAGELLNTTKPAMSQLQNITKTWQHVDDDIKQKFQQFYTQFAQGVGQLAGEINQRTQQQGQ